MPEPHPAESDDRALLEDLRSVEGLDWALLESYRRIGCTLQEALVAVAGDLLQHADEPGRAEQLLEVAGLDRAEVVEALGLPLDRAPERGSRQDR